MVPKQLALSRPPSAAVRGGLGPGTVGLREYKSVTGTRSQGQNAVQERKGTRKYIGRPESQRTNTRCESHPFRFCC